jgi:hypothetical protein
MALMRGTIHLVTAADAWGLRPLVQPVMDRVQKSQFGKRLAGVDLDEVVRWAAPSWTSNRGRSRRSATTPDAMADRDRFGLEQAVRTGVPLVQVPAARPVGPERADRALPRSRRGSATAGGTCRPSTPCSCANVGAFGPASVMDAQAWCGLTKLGEVFERHAARASSPSATTVGRELFDLPSARDPIPRRPPPPRFLYDFENMLLSYADRSA